MTPHRFDDDEDNRSYRAEPEKTGMDKTTNFLFVAARKTGMFALGLSALMGSSILVAGLIGMPLNGWGIVQPLAEPTCTPGV